MCSFCHTARWCSCGRNTPCIGCLRREEVHMADLGARQRKSMRKRAFAYVDARGEGHLPLNDDTHVRNAMARWNQTGFPARIAKEHARRRIVAAARRQGIEISKDDNI